MLIFPCQTLGTCSACFLHSQMVKSQITYFVDLKILIIRYTMILMIELFANICSLIIQHIFLTKYYVLSCWVLGLQTEIRHAYKGKN
jgi:hypothetical protein